MNFSDKLITISLKYIEPTALVFIAIATTVALCKGIIAAYTTQSIELSDLLLMFIYLEVFAMIGNYLEDGHLPVRMPMYMAIVSLSRDLILVMTNMGDWRITSISIAMLIIALTITVVRWCQLKSAAEQAEEEQQEQQID